MRPHWVWIIFKKEIKETLRDHRSIFLMVILPLLLYPLLFRASNALMLRHWSNLSARSTTVAVWGELPPQVAGALSGNCVPSITVLPIPFNSGSHSTDCENARKLLSEKKVDIIIQVHNQLCCDQTVNAPSNAEKNNANTDKLQILYDGANDFSTWSATRVEGLFKEIFREKLRQHLRKAGLNPALADPYAITRTNLADEKRMGGHLAGRLLPLLLVLMVLLGTFYPAIELTAGEKERGTFETLRSMPVRATEIIVGKYLTVVAIALISASVNLLAMALAFNNMHVFDPSAYQLYLIDQSHSSSGLVVTGGMVAQLFLLLIPPALFFSSLMLAASTLAKDLKEGQNLLTPVFLMCILPAALVSTPGGFELNWAVALVPVVNVALLIKDVLMGDAAPHFLLLILIANTVYAALMLLFAARSFHNEQLMWDNPFWKRFLSNINLLHCCKSRRAPKSRRKV